MIVSTAPKIATSATICAVSVLVPGSIREGIETRITTMNARSMAYASREITARRPRSGRTELYPPFHAFRRTDCGGPPHFCPLLAYFQLSQQLEVNHRKEVRHFHGQTGASLHHFGPAKGRLRRLCPFTRRTEAQTQGRSCADFASKLSIAPTFSNVRPMSSNPLSRQCLRHVSTSNAKAVPSAVVTVCASRSTVIRAFWPFSASFIRISTCSCGSAMGRIPFLKQLLKKMSAKDGAITQRMPKSRSAHGACSRLDPQPKFSPETRISASR